MSEAAAFPEFLGIGLLGPLTLGDPKVEQGCECDLLVFRSQERVSVSQDDTELLQEPNVVIRMR